MRSVLEACKFDRINQIAASRVQQYLAELGREGKSISMSNHYMGSVWRPYRSMPRPWRVIEAKWLGQIVEQNNGRGGDALGMIHAPLDIRLGCMHREEYLRQKELSKQMTRS